MDSASDIRRKIICCLISDPHAWHNQFYSLVTTKIDEALFKPLFPEGKKSVKAVTRQGTRRRWRIPWENKTGWRYFEDKDIKAYLLRKQIESLPPEEQRKRNNVEAAMFRWFVQTKSEYQSSAMFRSECQPMAKPNIRTYVKLPLSKVGSQLK